MCSDATTEDAPEATLAGAAEPAFADLPPAAPSPAAPPLAPPAIAPASADLPPAAPSPSPSPAAPPLARPAAAPPRTILVGLGNPLLGDDGVGWRVVDLVEARLGDRDDCRCDEPPRFDAERLAVGGLALMERLVGYERAVLVDAIATGDDPPGTVRVAPLAEVSTRAASHLDSAHDAPLTTALTAGRSLGADLPTSVIVVTVEAARLDTFDERLTPAVAEAVWSAADAVLAELGRTAIRPE